jgi:hypothetical protein
MAFKSTHAAALCAVLLASGCSFAEDTLFPENEPVASDSGIITSSPLPALGSTEFESPGVTPGSATGTYVGQKVTSLRNDLAQLQGSLVRQNQSLQAIRTDTVQDSQRYHGTVAAINARLQVGTTPGNPILSQQWNAAQGELDRINEDVLRMNQLANEVTASSTLAGYVLDAVRAARTLSGAVDEDHRQLRILEDETNRTVVAVERLLTELSDDALRQQQYVANERQNLNTLALAIKNGQLYGQSLATRALGPATFVPAAPRGAGVAGEAALVTIRFDKPNVNYEGALYTAVKSALDRRPDASFEVVAVSPTGTTPGQQAMAGTTARRNADSVVRSLANMGLPSNRIRVSNITSPGASAQGEVQVFVR